MSHIRSDFIGELQEVQLAVTGFHGTKICKVYKGTLLWHLEDDEGVVHDTRISGSYYIPGGKHRLISPQHWSQKAEGRASCLTLHDRAILKWKDGQAIKMVPIDSQNVFTFDLAPGYYTFSAFCMQAQYDHDGNDCNPATMPPASYEQNEETDTMWNAPDIFPNVTELDVAHPSTFDMNGKDTNGNGTSNDTRVTRASQRRDPTAELLRLHYKFGHASFSRLRAMARNGALRKDIEKCPLPVNSVAVG
jgi:hypothetical protein